MIEKDKLINDTSETFKNYDATYKIVKTNLGFNISKKPDNISELTFFIFFLFVVPIGLVFYDPNKTTIIIALFWELVFAYQFYQIKFVDNELDFDINEKVLNVKNISLIFKHFISPKTINLKKIVDFEFKRVKHTRHGLASFRLIIVYENCEKEILNDFDSIEGAKRIKYMIDNLIDETDRY